MTKPSSWPLVANVVSDKRKKVLSATKAAHFSFFETPEPAGRTITAGFSFLQQIGKGATTNIWFPEELRATLDAHMAAGHKLQSGHFPAEWAAVRQFELLQESGNVKIADMDVTQLERSLLDASRSMRAGGYRVSVVTLGSYSEKKADDDLEVLDKSLQDRIAALTHMLYLEEESRAVNDALDVKLARGNWTHTAELPHIGLTLGARGMFGRAKKSNPVDEAYSQQALSEHFFNVLGQLPQKHIVHDAAIGLQLPEAIAEQEWIYLAAGDMTFRALNSALTDVFAPFDGIKLSHLRGYEAGSAAAAIYGNEVKATTQHMRGYGDRLNQKTDQFYAGLAHLTLQ